MNKTDSDSPPIPISAGEPPQFPCWLWHTGVKFGQPPSWSHHYYAGPGAIKRCLEEGTITHWHPDQPEAPSVHPGEPGGDWADAANVIACHFVGNSDISLEEGRAFVASVLARHAPRPVAEDIRGANILRERVADLRKTYLPLHGESHAANAVIWLCDQLTPHLGAQAGEDSKRTVGETNQERVKRLELERFYEEGPDKNEEGDK